MIPVILSGGSGSRLLASFPQAVPQQFLALTGDDTLFQQTIKRLAFDGMHAAPLLVAPRSTASSSRNSLRHRTWRARRSSPRTLRPQHGAGGGHRRDETGRRRRDELLLILPADHVIEDQRAFQQAPGAGHQRRRRARWCSSAFPPAAPRPATATSARRADAQLPEGVQPGAELRREARRSPRARESPSPPAATTGTAAMFLFRASRYLEELKKHDADIYDTCLLALEPAASTTATW
ncbi:sugar phosphate nucleotidyltransferase [Pseudomonas aeruginosa]